MKKCDVPLVLPTKCDDDDDDDRVTATATVAVAVTGRGLMRGSSREGRVSSSSLNDKR